MLKPALRAAACGGRPRAGDDTAEVEIDLTLPPGDGAIADTNRTRLEFRGMPNPMQAQLLVIIGC